MADRQIKVLLIEDNPGDARLIEEMLSEVNGALFDLENADRLSDGITRIQKGGIDAVLLDLGLPDSAGLDTFEKVHDQAPEVPIVMLTGLDDTELSLEGVRMGAQDYLVKGRVDGDLLARTLRYAIERKTVEARIEHLNSVLKAIRNVNQLIVTETGRDSLLRKSCDALVDARGYDAVWLGSLEDGERFATVVGSGFPDAVSRFSKHVTSGDHPPCIRDALREGEKVLVLDKSRECGDCFFKDTCLGKEALIVRVEHADRFFGLLAVLLAPGVAVDEAEKGLLTEVASDIGIALHNSEMRGAHKVAEDALLESEKKYKTLYNSSRDAIMILTPEEGFLGGNSAAVKMFGCKSEEEFTSKSPADLSPVYQPDGTLSSVEAQQNMAIALKKGSYFFEWKHKRINGREFFATVLLARMELQGRKILQATVRDITEQKAAEGALLESENKLRLIIENMPVMLDAFDDKGNIIVWNSECEKVTGFNSREIINNPKAGKMLYPDEDYENHIRSTLMEYGSNFRNLEWDIVCKDGSNRTILWSNISEKYPIPGWYSWAIGIDITERKVAEELLRVAGERFKTIVETAPSVLMISDAEGGNIYVSPNCEEFTGYDPDELTGGIMQWVHEDDAKRAKDIFDRTFGRGAGCKDFEYKSVKKNGDVWCASSSWEPIIDAKGKFKGAISQTIDITERKAAEDALLESERKYSEFFGTSRDPVFITTKEGKLVESNDAFMEVLGYETMDELLKINVSKHYENPDDKKRFNRAVEQDGFAKEFPANLVKKDGGIINTLITATVIKDRGGGATGFQGTIRDITERKTAEDALKGSEERYRVLFETAKDAIFLNDETGKFMDVNSAACELLGYSKEELLKLSNREIDADPRGYEAFTKVRNGLMKETVFEVNQQRKDGTLVPVEISGKSFEIGDRKLFLAIARDITEHKRAEDQIKASLREKEVLLREIHHRVKNNLQVVSSLLNMQARNAKDKNTIEILSEASDRIKTMSLIHSQLYESRDLAEINMKEFVDRLLGQLLQSYPVGDTRITPVVRVDDYPFPISVAVPVGLIINELLSNALKHAFEGRNEGKIEVSLIASEGGGISLTVGDDGAGLPPGFNIDESKTLGLRLVKILTEDQLQGTLEVTSDGGATFAMEFDIGGGGSAG